MYMCMYGYHWINIEKWENEMEIERIRCCLFGKMGGQGDNNMMRKLFGMMWDQGDNNMMGNLLKNL